jgi:hypothetical protein
MHPQPSQTPIHGGASAALLPLEIQQSIELDRIAPVPAATRKRGPNFVRAFRAYAYEGMRWAPQLSKLTGITANMIRKARSVDRWDDFLGTVHDREAAARYGINAATVNSILPANGHKIAEAEQAERGETCAMLQSEIRAIREQMKASTDKGSKTYSNLLSNLRNARNELDSLLGISRIDKAKEAGAIQAARIAATPPPRPSLHSSQRAAQGMNGNASQRQPLETDCVDVSSFIMPS